MIYKFNFKNINISFKKLKIFSKNILSFSTYIFEILVYLNFIFSKPSVLIKKIFIYVLNNLGSFIIFNKIINIKIKNLLVNSSSYYKRFNYRSKGRSDFILKKFCNVILFLYI